MYTTRIVAHFLTKEMSSICERTTAICCMMWDKKKKTNKLREGAKVIAADRGQHLFSKLIQNKKWSRYPTSQSIQSLGLESYCTGLGLLWASL